MVHRDLSPDKMCRCRTLPFVAGEYLKGAQSFWRPLWPRLTCVFLWEFTCTRGTCVEMQVTFSESRLAKVWRKQEAHTHTRTHTGSASWQDTAGAWFTKFIWHKLQFLLLRMESVAFNSCCHVDLSTSCQATKKTPAGTFPLPLNCSQKYCQSVNYDQH